MYFPFLDCKGQGYFDEATLLNYPVDLHTRSSYKEFSVSNARSCSLSPDYSVLDYDGFQSKWETKSDGFFVLDMHPSRGSFKVQVRYIVVKRKFSGQRYINQ